jgi:enamine deaminase RidA (YjgF/YER057c/UK114 family)
MASDVDGVTLPRLPAPLPAYARYSPVRWQGNALHVSGQVAAEEGAFLARGRLGAEVDPELGRQCARQCALNVLAAVAAEIGDLDRVIHIVKVTVFVASDATFTDQHKVADGASDLFIEMLGDRGVHSRSAVGVAGLPMNSPVEVEAIVQVGPGPSGPGDGN